MKALLTTALDHFAIPGDPTFPLNQAFEPPRDRQDAEVLRQYVFNLSRCFYLYPFIIVSIPDVDAD